MSNVLCSARGRDGRKRYYFINVMGNKQQIAKYEFLSMTLSKKFDRSEIIERGLTYTYLTEEAPAEVSDE